MSDSLAVAFAEGTHRLATPQQTLARIGPLLAQMGITRAADITGLDRFGIPTWSAIRPSARILQVSNGKGLSHETAKVSALMEAIEHWHAEYPAVGLRAASAVELSLEGLVPIAPPDLPEYDGRIHYTAGRVIDWVRGESLADGAPIWLPASSAVLIEPAVMSFTSNGLASGNHLVEATLHALYEVIERDAIARFYRAGGAFSLPRGESRVVDLTTVPSGPISWLCDRIRRAGVQLVLVRVDTATGISTFWAVLLDRSSQFACSSVNLGQGSHLNPTIAAARAITEAAQSRLTFIHGSREDMHEDSYEFGDWHARVFRFFERQSGDLHWSAIGDRASGDLGRDLDAVTSSLCDAGYGKIYRIDLTNPRFGIPVVKMLVPGLLFQGH